MIVPQKQRQTLPTSIKNTVMREFKAIKKDKFRDEQISGWFEAPVSARLVHRTP